MLFLHKARHEDALLPPRFPNAAFFSATSPPIALTWALSNGFCKHSDTIIRVCRGTVYVLFSRPCMTFIHMTLTLLLAMLQ